MTSTGRCAKAYGQVSANHTKDSSSGSSAPMREDELLDEALEWCAEHGIEFDAVNDNTEEQKEMYGNNPRKIYADIYIDDHNLGGIDWEVFE